MTVGALVATFLGLVVGIGGMWLAWKLVPRLPDEPSGTDESMDETSADKAPGEQPSEDEGKP